MLDVLVYVRFDASVGPVASSVLATRSRNVGRSYALRTRKVADRACTTPRSPLPQLPRLLVLTPSADLYGSDRALLLALPAIVERFEVVLGRRGRRPDARCLPPGGASRWCSPVIGRLRRRGLRPTALPRRHSRCSSSLRTLRRLHRANPFAWSTRTPSPTRSLPFLPRAVDAPLVVHVREVPRDRGRLARVLFGVVERVADRVVCNSAFTGRSGRGSRAQPRQPRPGRARWHRRVRAGSR